VFKTALNSENFKACS